MNEDADDRDFALLTAKITRERGFACASYKDRCLRRRIAVRMRARGVHRYAEYSALLDKDGAEYEQLLQALTINVTRLFRNREVYETLARKAVPPLWSLPDRSIRVWSAGCASGEEPYSLAILFHMHAQALGEESRLSRLRVLGTDIDPPSLKHAERGEYRENAFLDAPQVVRDRYFSPGWPARVNEDVRRLVEFRHADIFGDDSLIAPFHLIVCRNVIIYFDRTSQEKVFSRFHQLLAPGGFLVLGKVETILGEARHLFTPIDTRDRVFRKP